MCSNDWTCRHICTGNMRVKTHRKTVANKLNIGLLHLFCKGDCRKLLLVRTNQKTACVHQCNLEIQSRAVYKQDIPYNMILFRHLQNCWITGVQFQDLESSSNWVWL